MLWCRRTRSELTGTDRARSDERGGGHPHGGLGAHDAADRAERSAE